MRSNNEVIRILVFALMLSLIVSAQTLSVCAAEDNHGADSHSPSMSNEVGAEPIVDSKSSTDATAENDVLSEDVEVTGDQKSTLPDADDNKAVKKAQEESEKAVMSDGEEKSAFFSKLPKWAIIVTIAVAIMALAAAIMLFRSRRKDKYESKH